jgi:hypothetical protein
LGECVRVPEEFREEELLRHVCRMIGKPKEVDKEALKGKGPDRVMVKCKDLGVLWCTIDFFFGDTSHCVTFEGEDRTAKDSDSSSGSDPKDSQNDKGDDREDKGGVGGGSRDTEESDSTGEFKKTKEQKATWNELKRSMEGGS